MFDLVFKRIRTYNRKINIKYKPETQLIPNQKQISSIIIESSDRGNQRIVFETDRII
jgi:hypothetical protein